MSKPRKFDRKNAIRFNLVNRSQQDPLINYEDAPQAVFVEDKSDSKNQNEGHPKYEIYYDEKHDYVKDLKNIADITNEYEIDHVFDKKQKKFVSFDETVESKEDEDKKKTNDSNELRLPSSLFESGIRENTGMLNKAALSTGLVLDWDPEILEAMEDEFDLDDPNNQLDDDFVIQAQGSEKEKLEFDNGLDDEYRLSKAEMNDDLQSVNSSNYDEEDEDKFSFRSFGAKSQFTEYSVSSSIMRRNKGLVDLDEQFEEFYLKDYADDTLIGRLANEEPIDEPETEKNQNDEMLLKELLEEQRQNVAKSHKIEYNGEVPKDTILRIAQLQEQADSDQEDQDEVEIVEGLGKNDAECRWDCESILSTYSNLYNHPTLIREAPLTKLKVDPKTGLPKLGTQLSAKALKKLEESGPMLPNGTKGEIASPGSINEMISQLSLRNKDETPEERRNRKNALKQFMKERREEKKITKNAFKSEHLRQQREKVLNRTSGAMKMN